MNRSTAILLLILMCSLFWGAVGCDKVPTNEKETLLSETGVSVAPSTETDTETDLPEPQAPPKPPSPPEDYLFTVAIIPDTQQETTLESAIQKQFFLNRIRWLADHAEELDLQCVIHTGDVVNWGNEDPRQFQIASEALAPLDTTAIPVLFALGNHDTAAVTVGGSAADPSNTRTRLRDTDAFNQYFSLDRYEYLIPFEQNKIDNVYHTFTAGESHWLVLALELWPRNEVIDWAKTVVEAHPDHNVIIATHSHLTSNAEIYQKRDYGHNSPQTLYDELISQYPNVRLVFSGHTGQAAYRTDTGVHGNKIVSFLGCFHSTTKNPVQLLEIDTLLDTVSIRTYIPLSGEEWEPYAVTVEEMGLIMATK